MADDRLLETAEKLQGQLQELCFMINFPILVEAIRRLRWAHDRIQALEEQLRGR